MKKTIIVTFQLEGWHHWAEAPQERYYLRSRHRHLFHFRVEATVSHSERQLEFHDLLDMARPLAQMALTSASAKGWSCETIAEDVLSRLKEASSVEVWEDGECGARIERDGGYGDD